MKTLTRTASYPYQPDIVFRCLDNLGVTGMHMTQSSMMMMGSKLDLQFLTENRTGLGTKYRWTGKMMGMKMNFTVEVTKWINGEEKVWETIGHSELIIYSWYRMHLQLTKMPNGTKAQLSISYRPPEGIFYKIISFLLADWYCRWCLRNMLEDGKKILLKNYFNK
ncbi:MAG: hypothetical protein HOP30_02930 [Cyclobacteriaceae bacterium]|nr:hypothetical protein [Cyclobacteriaceae bacterium]